MASGNLWQLFKNVTEQGAKQLATVIDRTGSSYTVTMQGGSVSMATSSAAYDIGNKVFVRDGEILGIAPDLPYTEIEV
ncbi:hypothetical protein ACTXNA_07170 [Psychrobacter celer]|uniref:hypothetical protein n=1 Tax=Psychrobacter celer TaxID=306572 RepID=UPI003FD61CF0